MIKSSVFLLAFFGSSVAWSIPEKSDPSEALSQDNQSLLNQLEFDLSEIQIREKALIERKEKISSNLRDLSARYLKFMHTPKGTQFTWEDESGVPRDRDRLGVYLKAMINKNLQEVASIDLQISSLNSEKEWTTIQLKEFEKMIERRRAQKIAVLKTKVLKCARFPLDLPSEQTGEISQSFGKQVDRETGIEWSSNGWWISGTQGGAVKACQAGTVLFYGVIKGRGLVVMLDHGSDNYTVYGNLVPPSSLALSRGVRVPEGYLLGATQDKVYFEARAKGIAVNPSEVLSSNDIKTKLKVDTL